MYRTSSWNRDDYNYAGLPTHGLGASSSSSLIEGNEFQRLAETSETDKKERGNTKLAENIVHLIPLVLFLCFFILWLVSNPDIEAGLNKDMIATKIEGLTLEGDIDHPDSDGTQTGLLPILDEEDNRDPRFKGQIVH